MSVDEFISLYRKKLTAYDFKPNQWVYVLTDEGYTAMIPSAFAVIYDEWVIIFAEHHSPQYFSIDDLIDCVEFVVKHNIDSLKQVSQHFLNGEN